MANACGRLYLPVVCIEASTSVAQGNEIGPKMKPCPIDQIWPPAWGWIQD